MAYIENQNTESGCFLCDAINSEDDARWLVIYRAENAFVILNRYPYINGHMLIAPYDHTSTIENLPEKTLSELMHLTSKAMRVLRAVYGADSFNTGMNIGAAAGAGLADHVHIHILPRWAGDTNFMTTSAQTRVLPEDLDVTWERIRTGWDQTD
jgi:ATP adenylyltransferase